MITRVRYFTGQLLGVADFETEQRYVIDRLRRHNRWLHGWGIVGGLQISVGREEIVVAPGFAIDCFGNEIEVEQPSRWPLPDASKACFLTIAFAERAVLPAAVAADPATSGDGESVAYSRVEEGWLLAYAAEDPARGHPGSTRRPESCGRPHAVALARLVRTGFRWRLDPRFRPGHART